MRNYLAHVGRVIHAVVREKSKDVLRSPKWSGVRKRHLKDHSVCAACGRKTFLQVHHMVPFSDRPDLELEPTNLITLCMSINECHIHIGHGGSYKYFNPKVQEHSALMFQSLKPLHRVNPKNPIWPEAKEIRRDKP